jgi:MFS family permease
MIKKYFDSFKQFDKVTEFRIINSLFIAMGMALLVPVIISLKGIYFAAWLIGAFSIVQTLTVKTNGYIVENMSIRTMFRLGVYVHFAYIAMSLCYFWNPELMLWADSILGIIEVALFSAFSISLTNYMTDNFPKDMSKFQIVRNSTWADGYLTGLFIVTVVTYFGTIGHAVILFIIFNIIFNYWMIKNWNIYNDIEYCCNPTLNHTK